MHDHEKKASHSPGKGQPVMYGQQREQDDSKGQGGATEKKGAEALECRVQKGTDGGREIGR